jgi:hypothetical protein
VSRARHLNKIISFLSNCRARDTLFAADRACESVRIILLSHYPKNAPVPSLQTGLHHLGMWNSTTNG